MSEQIIKMKLKRETDMIFFPSVKVSLTFNDPGPVDVNVTELSEVDKRAIDIAWATGRLEIDNYTPLVFKRKEPAEQPKNVVRRKTKEDIERERRIRLVSILKKSAREAMKDIGENTDIRDIKFLLKTEKENKKRKTVLKLLSTKVKQFEQEVLVSSEKESELLVNDKYSKIGTKFEVEEEEVGQVEVPLKQ